MAWIKAYKGFNKDMTCKGFQFEEGKEYELPEGVEAKLCESGFHACEDPNDCFGYYEPGKSIFREVELDATDETSEDSKRVGRRIRIGAELDVAKIVKAHFEYVNEWCTPAGGRVGGDGEAVSVGDRASASAGYRGSASAGNYGSASAGNYGSASAGNYGSASAGNYGSASAGYSGSASAGYRGSASAGNYGSASAGESGSASAGYRGSASAGESGSASAGNYGSASAGNYGSASAGESGSASAGESGSASAGESGSAVSRGRSESGENGISVARGNNVRVRGGLGAVLVIAEENIDDYTIKAWKSAVVDGETVKADTWYKLQDGEFVECGETE